MASRRAVPQRHLASFAKLLSLSNEDFQTLISALQASQLTLEPDRALLASIKRINSLSPGEARAMSDALLSLYVTLAGSGETTATFVKGVLASVEATESEELKLSPETYRKLNERLIAVLNTEPLATSTRAVSLQLENLYTATKFRVVTDMRPVFGESASELPKAAMVVHFLNVHYYEGVEHKEFYVALDTVDLQDLIDRLRRAQAKAEQLKSIIKDSGIPLMIRDEDHENADG